MCLLDHMVQVAEQSTIQHSSLDELQSLLLFYIHGNTHKSEECVAFKMHIAPLIIMLHSWCSEGPGAKIYSSPLKEYLCNYHTNTLLKVLLKVFEF